VVTANRQLREAIESILANNENLTIFQINQALMVNGQKIDVGEFKWITEDLLKFMMSVELKGIIFHRGFADREMEVLMAAFGRPKPKVIDKDFWQRFTKEEHLARIELKQVRYTLMVDGEGQVKEATGGPGAVSAPPVISYQLIAKEQRLDQEDMARIPDILRSLLSASKNIKLYPLESKAIAAPLEQLMEALRSILSRRQALTLAQVSQTLVVNGMRINVSGIETLADGFLKFLDAIMLTSLTFLSALTHDELKAFIGALGQLPSSGLSKEYWVRLAQEKGLTALLFDQVLYETRVTPSMAATEQEEPSEEVEEEEFSEGYWVVQMAAPYAEEPTESFFKEMPDRVNDLLMKGDEKQIRQLMKQLFRGFQRRPFPSRERIVDSSRRLMDGLKLGFQHHFSKLLADPLIIAFSEEKDPKMLREIAFLLHHMATHLIQFGEYSLSTRILQNLYGRYQKLLANKDPEAQRLAKFLDKKLEPTTQQLLVNDLKSGELSRQESAARLLGSLGQVTLPLLVDIIKKEEDLRARKIAVGLLGELGTEAGDLLKKELVLGSNPVEQLRILEVIDTVTRDLKTELVFGIESENSEIREAAFKLAERVNNPQIVELLMNYARGQHIGLAVDSITCLGRVKPQGIIEPITSLLESTKDTRLMMACCQALGQIGEPAGVEPLLNILKGRGSFFRRQRRNPQIRATAAFALAHIPHPRVAELLSPFVDDPDARVREIARGRAYGTKPIPPKK
jgi:HEAT repeat protein